MSRYMEDLLQRERDALARKHVEYPRHPYKVMPKHMWSWRSSRENPFQPGGHIRLSWRLRNNFRGIR